MKKAVLLVVAAAVFLLVLAGTALAATPQDIYDDYADNGKLDGTYTAAELEAYLNDATIHQYGDPTIVAGLDLLIQQMKDRHEFPFTGAQLALIAIVAVVLIAGGFVIRRVTRHRT